jgi:hypothetical protein
MMGKLNLTLTLGILILLIAAAGWISNLIPASAPIIVAATLIGYLTWRNNVP